MSLYNSGFVSHGAGAHYWDQGRIGLLLSITGIATIALEAPGD